MLPGARPGHPEAQNAPEPAREAQNGVDSRSGILQTPKELVESPFPLRNQTWKETFCSWTRKPNSYPLSLVIVPSLRSQADVLLRTPRLILSPVDFTDAGSVLALMEHPLVRNELEVELASPTRESLQQLPYYAARRLTDRQVIGGLGLHDDLVSFFVAPEYWGKGLGFEMVQHACRILAPAAGLDRLQAFVLRSNLRSRKLLESVGFQFEALVSSSGGGHAILHYVYRLN